MRSFAPQPAGAIPRGITLLSTKTHKLQGSTVGVCQKEYALSAHRCQTGGSVISPTPDVVTRGTPPAVRDHSAMEGGNPRLQDSGVLDGCGTLWYLTVAMLWVPRMFRHLLSGAKSVMAYRRYTGALCPLVVWTSCPIEAAGCLVATLPGEATHVTSPG